MTVIPPFLERREAAVSARALEQRSDSRLPRRRFILGAAGFAALALAGCATSGEPACHDVRRSGRQGRVLVRVPCPNEPTDSSPVVQA